MGDFLIEHDNPNFRTFVDDPDYVLPFYPKPPVRESVVFVDWVGVPKM